MKLIPKWIPGLLSGAKKVRADGVPLATSMTSETRAAQAQTKLQKVGVKLYDSESNSIQTTIGNLSDSHNFLFVPYVSRMFMETKKVLEDGKWLIYCSRKYHKSIDLKKAAATAEAASMTAKLIVQLRNGEVYDIQVEGLTGSMDLGLFDNDFSSNFTADAFMVLKTKSLEFLAEVPKRVYLLSMVISGLVGMIIGALAASGIIMVIQWIR
jgi:hypothetical protein